MQLIELIKNLKDCKVYNLKNLEIKGISCDSRKIKNNFIFVAIKGTKIDGTRFIPEAIKRGAKVVVAEKIPKDKLPKAITCICVNNSRRFYSRLCAEFYQNPSQKLKVIGVTGTNGKTTVTYLLEKILKLQNKDSLLIGTINYRYKDKIISSHNTTPSCEELQFLLSKAEKENIDYAIMEVSSHGLSQGRVDDVNFSFAIFTNLSQDHLDYHRSMSRYFNAKAKLFKMLSQKATAIINRDDLYGRKILKFCKAGIITYGLDKRADISASKIRLDINGINFFLNTPKGRIEIRSSLLGRYNIYNILSASSFAVCENIDLLSIKKAVEEFSAPEGRLERVYAQDFFVYLDYAHTPVALKNVLMTLRGLFKKRIILVFGCGGERDRGKRPKMGRIATELADRVIITSDNPRNEDPVIIIKDILKGIKKKNYTIIPDRKEAIFTALKEADSGDVVLVAGKGHEH
ncbi:MAG: UDP-N-acetylmuramoyl-L-alanyl-D-glutamate--2,6-diaminopimelate ligase, partial [Candidatus Omnitrophica bacterium]|nr:UDP-N-acetylmuramoyl-L-alanyl-D-glutamate--2,6-diaminopimelate ligase [Candidatus Omnitrophota bacterium]